MQVNATLVCDDGMAFPLQVNEEFTYLDRVTAVVAFKSDNRYSCKNVVTHQLHKLIVEILVKDMKKPSSVIIGCIDGTTAVSCFVEADWPIAKTLTLKELPVPLFL